MNVKITNPLNMMDKNSVYAFNGFHKRTHNEKMLILDISGAIFQ